MRTRVSTARRLEQSTIARVAVPDDERLFACVLSDVARMLWPQKTAANIAACANCSVRAAEFYLAGQREWSGAAVAAVVAEVLKRHGMRNIKVAPRR
jgi:hypothetical protein